MITNLQLLCINPHPMHRKFLISLAIFNLALILTGCSSNHFNQTSRYAEVKFTLDSANFETSAVHVEGEATCPYILFSIPLCKNQSLASVAWDNMYKEAQLEGKSAQIVNIFEDHSFRWNFFNIFFQEYYSVSGNVIVYKPIKP